MQLFLGNVQQANQKTMIKIMKILSREDIDSDEIISFYI